MIAVRQAVDSAFATLATLVDDATAPELEEVLLGSGEKTWRITVSYLVPIPANEVIPTKASRSGFLMGGTEETVYKPIGAFDPNRPRLIRKFKTIELDRENGDFRQLLTRDVEHN